MCVILVQDTFSVSFKKKNLTTHLRSYVQELCGSIQKEGKLADFVQGPYSNVRKEKTVILVQGLCNSIQRERRRQTCVEEGAASSTSRGLLLREIRTFGRAVEGSNLSPITNTIGGLSGGRRGGDMSGAASAPSLVVARLRTRALA